jgi:hypothetical protein
MNKISRSSWSGGDIMNDHRVMLNLWNTHQVEGINFFYNFEDLILNACIIDGSNNELTIESCKKFNLEYKIMPSFNLKSKLNANVPVEIKNIMLTSEHSTQTWANYVKLMNHNLTYDEVTRILDHMVVWNEVANIGKPRIVLESGLVIYRPISGVMPRNVIVSLDDSLIYNQHNDNFICMNGVHAYVIDQFSARALLNEVLINGIIEPLELMFRIDKFSVMANNCAKRVY